MGGGGPGLPVQPIAHGTIMQDDEPGWGDSWQPPVHKPPFRSRKTWMTFTRQLWRDLAPLRKAALTALGTAIVTYCLRHFGLG